MAARRVAVRVEGRVQGVGFRWFTRERAVEQGLTGFVRNRVDGAVEAVAEGDEAALSAWIDHVRQGPGTARVTQCHVQQAEPTGEFADFSVRS
jgi:acylphosphatase